MTAEEKRQNGSTSRSLLAGLRANEMGAWERLVFLYTPLVRYWCQRSQVPEQDISDIVQEVMQSVSTGLSRFHKDRPRDTFRGWLRVITRSRIADYFRSRSKEPRALGAGVLFDVAEAPEDSSSENNEDEQAHQALFHRALAMVREHFHEQTWQAFWRVVVDGVSPKEVAEELSMEPGAVRVAKCRVLQRLRQELGELLE